MVFLRKLNFRVTSARKRVKEQDALGVLLHEFQAAPIPPSETDWRDLQQRMARPQRTQTTQIRTRTREAKVATAVCAAVLLLAAHGLSLRKARSSPLKAPAIALISVRTPPQSLTVSANFPKFESPKFEQKSLTPLLTVNRKNVTLVAKHWRRHFALRRAYKRIAKYTPKALSARKLRLKAKAPNVETTKIALNTDGENLVFLVLPLEDALSPAAIAGMETAPRIYVTAAIPAAPPPGTIENESKEMHPW